VKISSADSQDDIFESPTVPLVSLVAEAKLNQYENQRRQQVFIKIKKQAQSVHDYLQDLNEEIEEEVKLIRQKYLLSALKRLKTHNDEYDYLLQEINRKKSESKPKIDNVQHRLKEIEAKHKKLEAEKEKKLNWERKENLLFIRNQSENIILEINSLVDGEAKKNQSLNHHHVIKQHQHRALSILNEIDFFLTVTLIKEEDIVLARNFLNDIVAIKASISKALENAQTAQSQSNFKSTQQAESTESMANDQVAMLEDMKESGDSSLDTQNENYDFAEPNSFKSHLSNQRFCIDLEKSLSNFLNDNNLKSYRNTLQQFIRTTINTIANGSAEQIKRKANLFNLLFTNHSIEFQDKKITCLNQPLSVNFCFSFAAKTFIVS